MAVRQGLSRNPYMAGGSPDQLARRAEGHEAPVINNVYKVLHTLSFLAFAPSEPL